MDKPPFKFSEINEQPKLRERITMGQGCGIFAISIVVYYFASFIIGMKLLDILNYDLTGLNANNYSTYIALIISPILSLVLSTFTVCAVQIYYQARKRRREQEEQARNG